MRPRPRVYNPVTLENEGYFSGSPSNLVKMFHVILVVTSQHGEIQAIHFFHFFSGLDGCTYVTGVFVASIWRLKICISSSHLTNTREPCEPVFWQGYQAIGLLASTPRVRK